MNEEAQDAAATATGEIRIVDPVSGSRRIKGKTFTTTVEQQFQGSAQGTLAGQFSDNPEGPWVTARAPGGGGHLEADMVQWDTQQTVLELDTAQHDAVHFRVGAWENQQPVDGELTGPPDHVSNVVVLPAPLNVANAVEPDEPHPGGAAEAP